MSDSNYEKFMEVAKDCRFDFSLLKKEPMPTLEEITLTPQQEALMVEMIRDVQDAPTPLKATVRYQKWTKKIFRAGVEAAASVADIPNGKAIRGAFKAGT